VENFDLIIIGGGSGGIAAAIKANQLKIKTALVNGGLPLGGTCVNVGCVPSKTLLWIAEVLYHAKQNAIPGLTTNVSHFEFEEVIHYERSLVEKLQTKKYTEVLDNLEYVISIEGKAKFVSSYEIEINNLQKDVIHKNITSKKFIIAVGSTANVPPIPGISDVGFITHIEALSLNRLPREMVIIGAGYIGLEFAQMYSRFGTKITVLERGESIFPQGERKLVDQLINILEYEGISFKTNVTVTSVQKKGTRKELTLLVNGKEELIDCDEILLATGKTANTKELNVEVAMSDFALNYYLFIIIGIIGIVIAFTSWKSTPKGKYKLHELILKTPVISSFSKTKAVVQFSKTLGMLIESGVNLSEALDIVCNIVDNEVLTQKLLEARDNIIKEGKIAKYLKKTEIFPSIASYMISTGEESGQLAQMLLTVGEDYDVELTEITDGLTAKITPIMTIIMAIIILFIILAIFLPMMQMGDVMGM